ncbi:MAG: YcxB family protein [Bacteroidia bacterium]
MVDQCLELSIKVNIKTVIIIAEDSAIQILPINTTIRHDIFGNINNRRQFRIRATIIINTRNTPSINPSDIPSCALQIVAKAEKKTNRINILNFMDFYLAKESIFWRLYIWKFIDLLKFITVEITTKEFGLTKKEYFRIILYNHIMNLKYIYAIMILLFGYYIWKLFNTGRIDIFFPMLIFILIFNLIYYVYFVNHKDNRNVFLKHTISFTDKEIKAISESGEVSTIGFDKIIKVKNRKEYVLLYINKVNFIYLPKSAFYSGDDYNMMLNMINLK